MILYGTIRAVDGSLREETAEGSNYDAAYSALRAIPGEGEQLLNVGQWTANPS